MLGIRLLGHCAYSNKYMLPRASPASLMQVACKLHATSMLLLSKLEHGSLKLHKMHAGLQLPALTEYSVSLHEIGKLYIGSVESGGNETGPNITGYFNTGNLLLI